ncbi:MAG TPA: homocysteine S-methyltransferase family protein [Actinomycetota bacterium]|nr:homocysteine S-methyltransferase family protein [Actinomycetota bacterium]
MAKHRSSLPQLDDRLFLTDGGIETTLIFLDGLDLPYFAAFHLLQTPEGEAALRKYFATYAALASRLGTGLVLESPTWRSNPDWATKLGYSPEALAEANRKAIGLMEEVRAEVEGPDTPVVISGCVGPRGDGYIPTTIMSDKEAAEYHREQVEAFAGTAADMVSAITMNYVEEAIGVTRAAQSAGMPVAVSFVVETDGKLATGQTLQSAVETVEEATSGYPSYYMINCAHPSHFDHVLSGGQWTQRIRGVRANASRKSHAELDEATELDSGDPAEFGSDYADLKSRLSQLNVMGGCCGTDHRHIDQIASKCLPLFATS